MITSIWIVLLAIIALLAISGFFSGSETAITAASRARMHRLAEDGNRRAGMVEYLIERRERLIGAILLGNNLVNILASALATSALLSLVGESGIAYATLGMTAMVVVFSEVLPKTYAITNPDRMALAVAPALRGLLFIFGPIAMAVQWFVRRLLRLLGSDIEGTDQVLSAHEELKGHIELQHREGGVIKRDRDMLGAVLDLADIEVNEVMMHRKNMVMINADQPPEAIMEQLVNSPYTRLPLWRDDPENIVGVLHAKDAARAIAATGGDLTNIDFVALAAEPWFVPETTPLDAQLAQFRRRKAHFALVVDEYGSLMGLVTMEDILEEIVGDISDEHDIEVKGVQSRPDGTVIVDGDVTIRDLNRAMDWNLPDEEATTMAGLVIHEAQMIPEPGQAFSFHGFKFEVLRRQRNQITSIRVVSPKGLARTRTG